MNRDEREAGPESSPMMDFCEGICAPFFEQKWRDRNAGRGFQGVLDQVEFESFMLLKLGLKLRGKRITKERARGIAWDITRDAFAEWFADRYMAENAKAIKARMESLAPAQLGGGGAHDR